ncbi:MAG TPA: TetR/AcrR family transcriptional regulator [Tenuifilaceae bacterium]|nr:TetR/AcrR family transcriptional regulator [Tenuifilaceae bacterium]HQB79356.1 TetR/AcrR family transcriptional regulator [Tenuifilaceae bacterium]
MQNRIIQKSREMFLRYGYSKIRLDEIAAELNISKKTIYNHFGSKEQLMFAVIEQTKIEFEREILAVEQNTSNSYEEEVKAILSLLGMWVSRVMPVVSDLRWNLPQAYDAIVSIKKDTFVKHGMRILNKGVEMGKVKSGWQVNLALYMFVATAERLLTDTYRDTLPNEMVAEFPLAPEDRLNAVVEILYSGIIGTAN